MKTVITRVLRLARRQRGESQAEVARRAGISQQLVSRIEAGRGTLEQAVVLARGVGVPVELQMGGLRFRLAHGIDPDERREIEANIAWFSGLSPAARLRTARVHAAAIGRLRLAAFSSRGGRGRNDGS